MTQKRLGQEWGSGQRYPERMRAHQRERDTETGHVEEGRELLVMSLSRARVSPGLQRWPGLLSQEQQMCLM